VVEFLVSKFETLNKTTLLSHTQKQTTTKKNRHEYQCNRTEDMNPHSFTHLVFTKAPKTRDEERQPH
jgi:hypothetical protein